jgi:hypothetical protein
MLMVKEEERGGCQTLLNADPKTLQALKPVVHATTKRTHTHAQNKLRG